jgi:hypothetical protein
MCTAKEMENSIPRKALFAMPTCSYLSVCFLDIEGWGLSPRGAGYLFGGDVVQSVS